MAYNEALAHRVREALERLPMVEEKKMFRGVTFMVDGKMCISVGDDEIMCRINPELQEAALQKKGTRAMSMKGRDYKGYVYVSLEGIESKKDFDYWIGLALNFNAKAKASPKRKKK